MYVTHIQRERERDHTLTHTLHHTHTNAHAAHTSNNSAYFNSQKNVYQKGFTAATIYTFVAIYSIPFCAIITCLYPCVFQC